MRAGLARPATVYRCFAGDELLYIGCTVNVQERFSLHKCRTPWWSDVTHTTFEGYDDHSEALRAERDAILAEDPTHNRHYLGRDRATNSPVNPQYVSTKQASEISGLSVATINRKVREGLLKPEVEGEGPRGARFFLRSDIEALS